MTTFTRKNMLVITATFTAADGTTTQPATANAYVAYTDTTSVARRTTIALTYNTTPNTWTGTWDSSNSAAGNVDWMVFGSGTIQASAQGSFQIAANTANIG